MLIYVRKLVYDNIKDEYDLKKIAINPDKIVQIISREDIAPEVSEIFFDDLNTILVVGTVETLYSLFTQKKILYN